MALLRSVYVTLYIENQYLRQFHKYIKDQMRVIHGPIYNDDGTKIYHEGKVHDVLNVDWVLQGNNCKGDIKYIDGEYIVT